MALYIVKRNYRLKISMTNCQIASYKKNETPQDVPLLGKVIFVQVTVTLRHHTTEGERDWAKEGGR